MDNYGLRTPNLDIDHRPTEIELQAFIGPRAEKYWRKWRWYIENDKKSAGTLWPPFFFSFVWFLYRRMYRELWVPIVIVFLVAIPVAFYEALQEVSTGVPYALPRGVDWAMNLAVGFTTSWFGSALYLRKLRRTVERVRESSTTPESAAQLLKSAGGTSPIAAAIGACVLVLLVLVGLAD